MILAAPLVIPFAKAVGLSIGTLGMAALADQVNDYIQENPEESMKILSTIIPNVGIGQIFMSKEDKISLEDLEDMTDEEAQDLSKEQKAELMKQAGKRRDRELSIATSEKIGLSGPGKEKQDIEYEIDERYDEGGVEEKKAPFDYTKFFRKRRADGGAIGIEVLFEEKKPRKDFNLGGLTGPAKNIYDSMMAAGYFTEDEIRNAIIGAGYEIPGASPAQPEQVTGIINQQIQTGGGGGDGGPQGIATPSTTYERTYDPDLNFAEFTSGITGTPSFTQEYTERKNPIEGFMELYQKFSPIGMIGRKIQQNRIAKQKIQDDAIAKAAAERAAQEAIRDAQRRQQIGAQLQAAAEAGGGYQPTTKDQNVARTSSRVDSSGNVKAYGLKDGGLVSMFVEKR